MQKLFRSSFWVQSLFYTLLHRFSIIFFGVITYLVLVRHITPPENGIWSLFLTIITLIELTKQGLLRNPLIKFLGMPEYANEKDKVQSTALFINLIFSLLAIIFFIVGGNPISRFLKAPGLNTLLLWNISFIILLIPFNHCEVILQSKFRYRSILYAYLLRQGLFMVGVIGLIYGFPQYLTLVNLVIVQAAALLGGTILILVLSFSLLPKSFNTSRQLMSRMLHFGKYVFGTNLSSSLSRYADHFVTANAIANPIVGKRYVSYYNAVSRITNLIDVPSIAVADVLFPKNVEALANEGMGKVKYYFEKMVASIVGIVLPVSIFIIIFPKMIILIIAGRQYLEAAKILQIMMITAIIRPFFLQFGTTMDAIGKPQLNFWFNLLLMFDNFLLTYFGFHWFGVIGVAYAAVVHSILGLLILYSVLRRQVQIELKNMLKYMLENYVNILSLSKRVFGSSYGS